MSSTTTQLEQQQYVRVGVGVLVKDPVAPTKLFAGVRSNSHGAGSLALPGGHLEMMETWEQCAMREVEEEMNVCIHNVRFAHVTNDIMASEHKHYVTVFVMGECVDASQRPINVEPHKCQGWESYSWEELKNLSTSTPSGSNVNGGLRLFGPLGKLVEEEPPAVLEFLGRR